VLPGAVVVNVCAGNVVVSEMTLVWAGRVVVYMRVEGGSLEAGKVVVM